MTEDIDINTWYRIAYVTVAHEIQGQRVGRIRNEDVIQKFFTTLLYQKGTYVSRGIGPNGLELKHTINLHYIKPSMTKFLHLSHLPPPA